MEKSYYNLLKVFDIHDTMKNEKIENYITIYFITI